MSYQNVRLSVFKYVALLLIVCLIPLSKVYASDNIAGKFDSFKIAFTWTQGFCYSHQDKPECKGVVNQIKQDSNLAITLHGLWPSDGSRIDYGYCKNSVFSEYNKEDTNTILLDYYMPSLDYPPEGNGFFLAEHEWNKHGRCQLVWNQAQYFYIESKMVDVMRDTYIKELKDKDKISKKKLYSIILSHLPRSIHKDDIDLECDRSGNILEGIWFSLSKDIQGITNQDWRNMNMSILKNYITNDQSPYDNCNDYIFLKPVR